MTEKIIATLRFIQLFCGLNLQKKPVDTIDSCTFQGPSAPKSRKGYVRRKCGGSRSYLKSKI